MSLILVIGNATINIINQFTQKHAIQRAQAEIHTVGGNAATTALVLAQHRHAIEWMGTIGADTESSWLKQSLLEQGINLSLSSQIAHGRTPVSYINQYQTNENHSVVHYRDLPELSLEAFEACQFSRYDWIHFEGRNSKVLAELLPCLQNRFDQIISLDIRRADPALNALIAWVDVVFFSKLAVQQQKDYANAETFLAAQHQLYPNKVLVCHWAEQGAYALDKQGELHFVSANHTNVVETLGAGDVFRAGVIHSLATGNNLHEALRYAVNLTERKVGQHGLSNLV